MIYIASSILRYKNAVQYNNLQIHTDFKLAQYMNSTVEKQGTCLDMEELMRAIINKSGEK